MADAKMTTATFAEQSRPFAEMAKWKLEAKEENNARYFLETNDVKELHEGEKCFVVGRKVSGKTAIAKYIDGLSDHNVFVRTLSFKSFPFNEVYKFADSRFTKSQYITFWKFVIYTTICEMMSRNNNIDDEASTPLKQHFDIDFGRALQRNIEKITQTNFGLSIAKSGVNGGKTKVYMENDTPMHLRVSALEDLIIDYVDSSSYYILFDELDEDYTDVFDSARRNQYFDLLVSRFKAVVDIREVFRSKQGIKPVVFVRDDIYDLMDDGDSNKWDDIAIKLIWTKEKLESLIAFRVSRAINPDGLTMDIKQIVKRLFKDDHISYGQGRIRKRHVLQHILDRTLMRPRDVISYLKECADIAHSGNSSSIDNVILKRADAAYSKRFRKEFVNEVHTVIPGIRDVFDLLSAIRKQVLTVTELRDRYNEIRKKDPKMLDYKTMCNLLFYFSIIGNQPRQVNTYIFKYEHPDANMNFDEKIIIHRGLMKALQII